MIAISRPAETLIHTRSTTTETNSSSFLEPSSQKVAAFINQVFVLATDPTLGIPMLLAAPANSLAKCASLRGLLAKGGTTGFSQALAIKILPKLAGFGTEATVFGLGARALTHWTREKLPWDMGNVVGDLAHSAWTLGLLKSAAWLGTRTVQWTRGLNTLQPELWTRGDRRAVFWAAQASGYLGLVASHSMQLRLSPGMHLGSENVWTESLGAHLALNLAAWGGRAALGKGFEAMEQKFNAQADQLYAQTKPQWNLPGLSSARMAPAESPPLPSRDPGKVLDFGKPLHMKNARHPDSSGGGVSAKAIQTEIDVLKRKAAFIVFNRDELLGLTQDVLRLDQRVYRQGNEGLTEQFQQLYNNHFIGTQIAHLSSRDIPELIQDLPPLRLENLNQWNSIAALLDTVFLYHPSKVTKTVAGETTKALAAKLDEAGIRVIIHRMQQDRQEVYHLGILLEEAAKSHPLADVRSYARTKYDLLIRLADLRATRISI